MSDSDDPSLVESQQLMRSAIESLETAAIALRELQRRAAQRPNLLNQRTETMQPGEQI
jgi:hypothetical protein